MDARRDDIMILHILISLCSRPDKFPAGAGHVCKVCTIPASVYDKTKKKNCFERPISIQRTKFWIGGLDRHFGGPKFPSPLGLISTVILKIVVGITLERVSRRDRSGPPSASDDDDDDDVYDCATELVHKHLHKRTRGGGGGVGATVS